ncbi:MAG: NAD(+)/NADH kinase [Deltaproteobacteria bacterium]|nr:MAG: NAD(+)/NADH kinase [Deltaproteobacteria bacterium]TMB30546.1 MAG: NAD(+)/NADH kinase [Deltaproteobacteria bacterium]
MATVGLIPRLAREAAAELAREMARWLEARGHTAMVEEEAGVPGAPSAPGREIAARADLLVVLGGDGTLIHAAGLCDHREVPILGVNMGALGFLTEVPRERAFPLLEKALNGDLAISQRLMLDVEVRYRDQALLSGTVLNDAVISKNALSRLATLEVMVDSRPATNYEADGVIVATPTGSTAYSLSAAGPIVVPSLDAVLLTPICPHALTQRPLVLPPSSVVRVRLGSPSEMFVTLDGARGRPLEIGHEVWIQPSHRRTLILRNPEVDHFTILREKLRWGTR